MPTRRIHTARRRPLLTVVGWVGCCLVLTLGACTTDDGGSDDAGDVVLDPSTTIEEGTDDPSISIDRNERGVEASSACAAVESGYLELRVGNLTEAQPMLEEGAALASQVNSEIYGRLAEQLVDTLSPTGGRAIDPVAVDAAADALLVQCDDDGFERIL